MVESARVPNTSGWRGVLLIAATYTYFLIFAQFGFLKRLAECHVAQTNLAPIMGAMALAGVLSSLLAQRLLRTWQVATRLRVGLLGCAAAAALSLLPLRPPLAGAIAALIGLSLGLLTVTLVAHLPRWIGARAPLLSVALGTGLGYFLCNIPWVFRGLASTTALVSGAGCLLAAAALVGESQGKLSRPEDSEAPSDNPALWMVLLAFTALIWLDSAAFYIIQNSATLKAQTWQGTLPLWRNGFVHLVAALASAWLLRHRGLFPTLLAAFGCIGAACLLLHQAASVSLAPLFYPAGVSLYSVALVAYPAFLLRDRGPADRERQAGLLYAIAGWFGSAMGIGMGQHLHRVPTTFVLIAGLAVALPLCRRVWQSNKAPLTAMAALAAAAWGLNATTQHLHPAPREEVSPVTRGRQVYIAEGCIHCHSQYVRPNAPLDVTMWGPGSNVEAVRRQTPPLIGNRRQGPDLSEVGGRRSPLWLRLHLLDPRAVSYRTIMPSYAPLFADRRGDALVAYLSSLRSPDDAPHLHQMLTSWTPALEAGPREPTANGAQLFQQYCATCHVPTGAVRRRWSTSFRVLPPDLFTADLGALPHAASPEAEKLQLERVLKFGLPGTDMPGHEYLPDTDLATLAAWLLEQRRVAAGGHEQLSGARSANIR